MKNFLLTLARSVLIGVLMLNTVSSVSAKGKGEAGYQTGFVRWRAAEGGFSDWDLNGVIVNGAGELQFASTTADTDPYAPGAYNGGNYYNGGSFLVGEATSPAITTAFHYTEAIGSWNVSTPPGSWVEIQFRAQYGTRLSKWYVLGIWAADNSTIERHSVQSQGDADGYVAVDTFVSSNKKETPNAFQLKIRLFSTDGEAVPTVRNASVAYSTAVPKDATASPDNREVPNSVLGVPGCSQMVYPDGGEVWCSPTSTSMVLGYWGENGTCEQRVRAAVSGVYDRIYDGHGNWPFNTAYAASLGYESYVVRFTNLSEVEKYIAAGIPVIMSIAWKKGELANTSIESTNGHLLVLAGFDTAGNPVVNDPAAPSDAAVQRTYLRSEFEPLWLQASGGTVYLIYPAGTATPAIP
jgi:hypothetical protein